MFKVLYKKELSPGIFDMDIEAPRNRCDKTDFPGHGSFDDAACKQEPRRKHR